MSIMLTSKIATFNGATKDTTVFCGKYESYKYVTIAERRLMNAILSVEITQKCTFFLCCWTLSIKWTLPFLLFIDKCRITARSSNFPPKFIFQNITGGRWILMHVGSTSSHINFSDGLNNNVKLSQLLLFYAATKQLLQTASALLSATFPFCLSSCIDAKLWLLELNSKVWIVLEWKQS